MKKNILLVAAILLLVPSAALADTISGRVSSAGLNSVDLTVFDAEGRPYPNALKLTLDGRTRLDGYRTISHIKRQDAITAEIRQERNGVWRAEAITKLQGSTLPPAAVKPSSPLMNSLTGQKIIRNAALGAVTGAVASSASGGKAGKGAAIGAGVGVVGGLLADMLGGQPQQEQQQQPVYYSSDPESQR